MAQQVEEIIIAGAESAELEKVMPTEYPEATRIESVNWPSDWGDTIVPACRQLDLYTLADLKNLTAAGKDKLYTAMGGRHTLLNFAISTAKASRATVAPEPEQPNVSEQPEETDDELPPIEDGPADDKAEEPEHDQAEPGFVEVDENGNEVVVDDETGKIVTQEPDDEPNNETPQRMSRDGVTSGRAIAMLRKMDLALADAEKGLALNVIEKNRGWADKQISHWRKKNEEFRQRLDAIRGALKAGGGDLSAGTSTDVPAGKPGPTPPAPAPRGSLRQIRQARGRKPKAVTPAPAAGDEAEAYSARVTDKLPAKPDTTEPFPPFGEVDVTPEGVVDLIRVAREEARHDALDELGPRDATETDSARARRFALEACDLRDEVRMLGQALGSMGAELAEDGTGHRYWRMPIYGADGQVVERLPVLEWIERRKQLAKRVGDSRHPLLVGLFQTLPEPGSVFDEDARNVWLNTAENIFELLYKRPAMTLLDQFQHEFGVRSGPELQRLIDEGVPTTAEADELAAAAKADDDPPAFPAAVEQEAADPVPGRIGHGTSPIGTAGRKRA
jgi:hypothetical protein